jgi:succinoglycan biosynthesis transport protein ExoP
MMSGRRGPFAEAIRALRHEIDACPPYEGPRVILVASSLPNEGKTVIASNLAHYFALTGARTLLIDADFRRRSLTRQLGIRLRPGLLDAIGGAVAADEAILVDPSCGLHFLPAGSEFHGPSIGAEAVGSGDLGEILARLKQRFEVIVVDAPPLLPVVDTRLVAYHADQIALVTSWRRTPAALAKRAVKCLGVNAQKVVGVVVNKVDDGEGLVAPGYGSSEWDVRRAA